jgi:hypothetical protein
VDHETPQVPRGKRSLLPAAAVTVAILVTGAVIALTKQNGSSPCACGYDPAAPAPIFAQRIVVTYFHRQVRDSLCLRLEASIKEAVESRFSQQLQDGRLEWRTANYEEPTNDPVASDYKFTTPCLVLARLKDGKIVEWRSLPEVWQRGSDPRAIVQLVERNVEEFLDYIAIPGACCT